MKFDISPEGLLALVSKADQPLNQREVLTWAIDARETLRALAPVLRAAAEARAATRLDVLRLVAGVEPIRDAGVLPTCDALSNWVLTGRTGSKTTTSEGE